MPVKVTHPFSPLDLKYLPKTTQPAFAERGPGSQESGPRPSMRPQAKCSAPSGRAPGRRGPPAPTWGICGHGPGGAGPSSIQLMGMEPTEHNLVPTRHTPQTRGRPHSRWPRKRRVTGEGPPGAWEWGGREQGLRVRRLRTSRVGRLGRWSPGEPGALESLFQTLLSLLSLRPLQQRGLTHSWPIRKEGR